MAPSRLLLPALVASALAATLSLACTTKVVHTTVSGDGGVSPVDEDSAVDPGPVTPDAGASAPVTKDGVSISVTRVEAALELGGSKARAGEELIAVAIEVANVSAPAPVPVALPLFTLATTDALVVTPDLAASTALDDACPQTTTIDRGGKLACAVVFAVKQNRAKELRYTTPSGGTLGVPMPPVSRCHDLPQLGKKVTSTNTGGGLSTFSPTLPPGTYVLSSVRTEGGNPVTVNPHTLRVTATTMDQIQTMEDGLEIQTSATYTRQNDGTPYFVVKTTTTCISPMPNVEPQDLVGTASYGFEASTQSLLEIYGSGQTVVRYKKVP